MQHLLTIALVATAFSLVAVNDAQAQARTAPVNPNLLRQSLSRPARQPMQVLRVPNANVNQGFGQQYFNPSFLPYANPNPYSSGYPGMYQGYYPGMYQGYYPGMNQGYYPGYNQGFYPGMGYPFYGY